MSDDLVERLRNQIGDDHVRGCQGRQYSCDCGYDTKTEGLLETAADRIEELTKVLEFFADPHNWRQSGPLDPNSGMFRGDTVARATLAPEQDK